MSAGHPMQNQGSKSIVYYEQDDILEVRLSDKAVVRDVSQGWNTTISYAEDGSVVEIVFLDAKKEGWVPIALSKAS